MGKNDDTINQIYDNITSLGESLGGDLPSGYEVDIHSILSENTSSNITEESDVFLVDNQTIHQPFNVIPSGPPGKRGLPGKGVKGDRGDPGERGQAMEWEFCHIGDEENAGIRARNADGSWSHCQRIKGDQGDEGPPGPRLEWEFCPIDFEPDAGVKFKNQDGSWSKCVRFRGLDGRNGKNAGGTSNKTQYTGGGGGYTPPAIVDKLNQKNTIIPPGDTLVVCSDPLSTSRSIKYFVQISDFIDDRYHASEIMARHNNSTADHDRYSMVGDTIFHIVGVNVSGSNVDMIVTNNDVHDITVGIIHLPLIP